MRIALIAPPWLPVPPPAYGGTETVLDQLARGLSEAGHEVVLHTTGDSTCPVHTAWVYEQSQAPRMADAAVELRHLLHAYHRIDAEGADVVHDHTLVGPVRAAAEGRPNVLTTAHGPFDAELAAIYSAIATRIAVIAISRDQARSAGETPIARVIHHGVDPSAYPVGQGDGGYVAFLGRMAPAKGVDIAIRAAREAGTPLLIAAKMREPAEVEYFESCVRPLLGGEVEYLGEVERAEKLELLRRARALLNPLRWREPFGMVMVEALACGTPVIAFARGSVPEIIDDGRTGWLCVDEPALVRALGRIDRLDRAACRRAVETRFSTARMVQEHLELYQAVVCRAGERGHRRANGFQRALNRGFTG
jgi:glycosyltransferase involved in cell wall biosynthesis